MGANDQLIALSEQVSAKHSRVSYSGLTPPERVFLCVWELEAEVNSGGFSQYYFNGSGDRAVECPDALQAIGAAKASAIVSRANAMFPGGDPPRDRELRESAVEALEGLDPDAFEAIDAEFYAYPDDLTELLSRYVSLHRDVIAGAAEMGF